MNFEIGDSVKIYNEQARAWLRAVVRACGLNGQYAIQYQSKAIEIVDGSALRIMI